MPKKFILPSIDPLNPLTSRKPLHTLFSMFISPGLPRARRQRADDLRFALNFESICISLRSTKKSLFFRVTHLVQKLLVKYAKKALFQNI